MNHRIHKLQGLLQKNDVDGVLYATSGNLQYFLNDASFWWQRTPETGGPSIDIDELDSGGDAGHFLNRPDCILYVPASDEPVLIMTYQRAKDMQHIPIQQETCFYDRIPDVLGGYVRGKRIACGESCNSYLKQVVARVCPDAEILDGEHYGEQLRKIKDEDEIATLRKAAASPMKPWQPLYRQSVRVRPQGYRKPVSSICTRSRFVRFGSLRLVYA